MGRVKSVGVAFVWNDAILLVRHPKDDGKGFDNCMSIPKGRVEPDEKDMEFYTAMREVKEEVNIDTPVNWILDSEKYTVLKSDGVPIDFFIIELDSLSQIGMTEPTLHPKNYQIEEVDYAAFIPFDEAVEKINKDQLPILEYCGYKPKKSIKETITKYFYIVKAEDDTGLTHHEVLYEDLSVDPNQKIHKFFKDKGYNIIDSDFKRVEWREGRNFKMKDVLLKYFTDTIGEEIDYTGTLVSYNDKTIKIGYSEIATVKGDVYYFDTQELDFKKLNNRKYKSGGNVSKTPAEKSEQIKGSDKNSEGSAESIESAKNIEFSEKTTKSIKNKVDDHNENNPDKKVNMAFAKAVVRRGMGAYSQTHRPTISGGKENARVAWGLARLDSALKKVITGQSPSGKHVQDDDLIEELGYKIDKKEFGGEVLLAPNGEPSNLTTDQYKLVRSPEFISWFGDWINDPKNSSKVVDENGEPLVVYHGTSKENIKSFDLSKIGSNKGNYGHYGYGVYFSTDIREASIYGKIIYECYIKISNPFTGTDEQILQLKNSGVDGIDDLVPLSIDFNSFKKSFKNKPYIYTFIESIEKIGLEKTWDNIREINDKEVDLDLLNDIGNLIEYTTLNKDVDGVPDYVFEEFKELDISPKINKGFLYQQSLHWITDLGNRSKEVTEVIESLGFDGVWYGSEIVVFNPNQIKLADGSNTIFDTNDPDIRMEEGGQVFTDYPKAESKDDLKPNKPMQSWLDDKKMVVLAKEGDKQEVVHFGHPDYEDFTQHGDLERRDNYLSRSAGIEDGEGELTKDDIFSANYWSRRILWASEENFEEGGETTIKGNNREGRVEKQQQKAREVIEYFRNNLPKDKHMFISTNPTTSETDFGVSTYFTVKTKNRDLEGYKFRISDHSVTNKDRIFGEIHYNEDSDAKTLMSELLERINRDDRVVEERNKMFDEAEQRNSKLNSFWEEVKPKYEDLGFHVMDRTSQDLETFKSKKEFSDNIYQKGLDSSMFRYEWSEPLSINSFGKKKPSFDYIENYLLPKYKDNFNEGGETYYFLKKRDGSYADVEEEKLEMGGIIDGQLHSECNPVSGCGVKFTVGDGGKVIEAERDEAVIVSKSFKNINCPIGGCKYVIRGTLSEIASAINVLGGGKNFDDGAIIETIQGESLDHIEDVPESKEKGVDRKLESGSIIINRRSMADKSIYEARGTAKQIASAINSVNGNGIVIEEGGSIKKIK